MSILITSFLLLIIVTLFSCHFKVDIISNFSRYWTETIVIGLLPLLALILLNYGIYVKVCTLIYVMPLCPLRQYYQIILLVNPRQRISNHKCCTAKLNVRASLYLNFSMFRMLIILGEGYL